MNIGVVFPQTEFGNDLGAIRDFAQTAEALGYNHILAYDHVLGAVHEGRDPRLTGPYTEATPFHEPFVLFAYWAAITSTIEFTTGVLILPQRQTALVAKQAMELDLLSGGRLRLGIGTGWNFVEYEALGIDGFEHRGSRQAEQVELMRKLWSEDVLDYSGRYHRIDRAGILPRSGRQIPIWFGGRAEAALRRAARIGDGFIFSGMTTDQTPGHLEKIRGMVTEAGRDPASFGIEGFIFQVEGEDAWARNAEVWKAGGATHLSFNTLNSNIGNDPAAHLKAMRHFGEQVMPGLR